jgi:phosphatidylserine/phosphatidylglycerophosphate/cardiolipin synthase-like enzyme
MMPVAAVAATTRQGQLLLSALQKMPVSGGSSRAGGAEHAIAHSKGMVIDSATSITGSCNFTKVAEAKNTENLLVITDAPELVTASEGNIRLHAGSAHPYERQAAAVSSGTAPARVNENGAGHGKKKSQRYHLPDCPGYAGMHSASVVGFVSEAAAEQAGYRKAKHCR